MAVGDGASLTTGAATLGSRKEKRKALKKQKRKQIRREGALRQREEEEALANDPEEQLRLSLMEKEEAELAERARREFDEREKLWLEAAARRRKEQEALRQKLLEEEEESRKHQEQEQSNGLDDDEWEYVEEGPVEIIWEEKEIIVKKKRVKVPKRHADQCLKKEEDYRPTSNPLPPQSAAFAAFQSGPPLSAQELLESVAQQTPNFGTEQDKAHCPFHLKTGACRFGMRCSRVHFYPDKSNTLLIKNMYSGPGVAWELDEGLEKLLHKQEIDLYLWVEMTDGSIAILTFKFTLRTCTLRCNDCYEFDEQYTDEEVERCYEEFYEDVHTEFLKLGEIVNFKVCQNSSVHLRGNVYVHYKSVESAVLAYQTINGRYYAGRQIQCEFVGITRWKIAICGEYMKSRLKTCSHGAACNFIHCFRNPGGDYEWADWDNPPPKYWVKKMVALFGHSEHKEFEDSKHRESSHRKKACTNKRRSRYGEDDRDTDSESDSIAREAQHSSRTDSQGYSSKRRKGKWADDDFEHAEGKSNSKISDHIQGCSSCSHSFKRSPSREKESSRYENNNFKDSERSHKRHRSVTSSGKPGENHRSYGERNSEGSYRYPDRCNGQGSPDWNSDRHGDPECGGHTKSERKTSRSFSDTCTMHSYRKASVDRHTDRDFLDKNKTNYEDVLGNKEVQEFPERYTPLPHKHDTKNKSRKHKTRERSVSSGDPRSDRKNNDSRELHHESTSRHVYRVSGASSGDSVGVWKKTMHSNYKEKCHEAIDKGNSWSFSSREPKNNTASEGSDSEDSRLCQGKKPSTCHRKHQRENTKRMRMIRKF